ncbi:MAG: putative ABC exporter domain-containing protein [Fimbriimonadales bacterium]|nr:putative ABC exporter domain-containing protein [Fimbriimonadales bacterium]
MDRQTLRVLAFQSVRVFVNSLRRAFSNPVRAVLTLLVISAILCGWGSALIGSLLGATVRTAPTPAVQPEQLMTRSVGIVLLVHWFYVVFTLIPSVFRPAQILIQESDVHYLFTTPLKPLVLFRGIILIRGLLGALFFMVLLILYLLMFGGSSLRMLATAQSPEVGAWAMLIYPVLYLLVFTTALLGSVALEAMEIAGRGRRKYWAWGLIGWAVACVAVVGGRLWFTMGQDAELPWSVRIGTAIDWLPAYLLLLPVRALADAALVLYNGFTPALWFGLVFWLAGTLMGNAALVRYQDRLYEVGASLARKGAQARAAQRDPYRVYLERKAESIAHKPRRTLRWLEQWTPRGVWALLWRDLTIMWRASGWSNLLVIMIIGVLPLGLMWLVLQGVDPSRNLRLLLRILYAIGQSMVVFFMAFGAYYGMADMLRRVEWQKPLPFSPRAVVIVESLPTVVVFALAQVLTVALCSLLFPYDWLFWLGGSLVAISWCIVLQMAMLWIALVNPDPTDYTQRLLTGVLMVPALFLSGAPGLSIWILGVALDWHLLLAAGLAFAANLFVGMVLTGINSALYEQFSPVD